MKKYSSYPSIVLIDDDPDDIEMLASSLEKKGITVKTFLSGEKAMHYFKHDRLVSDLSSLIILDYNMPKNNGEQMLVWIKNNAELVHIPVVMYSTTLSSVFQSSLISLGAYLCLVKPNNYALFKQHIELFKSIAINTEQNICPAA